ncbi:unnamed protein product, partial [Brenthis ino]
MSIGWMSPMSLLLQSKYSPRDVPLTDNEVSWMAAIPYLICVLFNSFIVYFVDKYGRKLGMILTSVAGAASWTLMLVSFNIWVLMLARAFVGITMSGCYVICPIYTKEISDASIRGALGCLVTLFHTLGNLFLYVLGDLLSYNEILWICLTIPIIHLMLFVFMPDSPSYLVKTGEIEAATKAITWLRCKSESDSEVQDELNVIRNEHKLDDEGNEFFLKTIFTDKILFKAFHIAIITTLAREVCGSIPVLNFAGEIFTLASVDGNLMLSPNQKAMFLGGVQVVGSIIVSSVVEKCGRKYRGTVLAVAMCAATLSDFLQLLFFKPLAKSVGIHVAFYFFGSICLLLALYVIIVIPETRARSLEDIYKDLGQKDRVEIREKESTSF